MRQARTTRAILLITMFVCVLSAAVAAQQQEQSYTARFEAAQAKAENSRAELERWQRQYAVALSLAISLALLGAATTGIQAIQKPWKTIVTGVMGLLVSVITALNSLLVPADFKTLNKRVEEGELHLANMDHFLDLRDRATTDGDREMFLHEIGRSVEAFEHLRTGASGGTISAALPSASLGVTLHAAAIEPPCSCDALTRRERDDFTYSCQTASSASLSSAREQAIDNAVNDFVARLRPARDSASQQAAVSDQASADYVRRIATEAGACVVTNAKQPTMTVVLRIPRALADEKAQTAFAVPVREAERIPNAAGEIVVPPPASRTVDIPVRANPRKYGDFVFTFSITGANPRVMQLKSVRVIQDGSVGQTKWTFSMLLDGTVVATLPEQNYSDDKPPYALASAIAVPASGMRRVKILGYRR